MDDDFVDSFPGEKFLRKVIQDLAVQLGLRDPIPFAGGPPSANIVSV